MKRNKQVIQKELGVSPKYCTHNHFNDAACQLFAKQHKLSEAQTLFAGLNLFNFSFSRAFVVTYRLHLVRLLNEV